jgi:hypothetical protein
MAVMKSAVMLRPPGRREPVRHVQDDAGEESGLGHAEHEAQRVEREFVGAVEGER